MPSISYYIVRFVLKAKGLKKIFLTDPVDYKKLRKDDIRKPSKRLLKGSSAEQFTRMKTTITKIVPQKAKREDFLVLYCPGGAFISGPNLLSWDSAANLVKRTGITMWMVDYPKGPETKIKETAANLDAVYAAALEVYDASKIILMGDSAGGGLILTLTQRLIEEQKALPQRLIAICPAFDCSLSNPEIDLVDPLDPMLSKKGIASAKKMCCGDLNPRDPIFSPLFGRFDGFPPVHLFMGEHDILYPDQKLGRDKMKAAGIDLEVIYGEKMPHIWPLIPVMKEARDALLKIETIINNSLPKS